VALGRCYCDRISGGRVDTAGGTQAAAPDVAEVRLAAASDYQPGSHGAHVLWHHVADRPRHAGIGQRPAAAQTPDQCRKLLDCSSTAWTASRDYETSILGELIMDFVAELWRFMRVRKKFWMLPILLMMLIFGGLIIISKGSAVAPFIYTLF